MPIAASINPKSAAVRSPPELPTGRVAHSRPAPEPTTVLHTSLVQSLLWHWFGPEQVAPVGNLGEQVALLLQKSSDGQSESVAQPDPQVCVVELQVSLRHCSSLSQEPSPGANPQLLSFESQAPELHTRMPTAGAQVAIVEGIEGSGVPFASFGTHMPNASASALHHSDALQSLSVWQPWVQRPLGTSQMFPAVPWQSASIVHLPHWPAVAPDREQSGAVVVLHGCVALEPLSPLQGTQAAPVASQTGVASGHWLESRHVTQVPLVVLHTGVGPLHCESCEQPTQVPWFAPVPAQIVERQTVGPFDAVHGPSPFS
jgi:hypothetical protein